MLKNLLNERGVPKLLSKDEMLHIMQNEVYGFLPPSPQNLHFETEENIILNFCAGNAVCHKVIASGLINGREFSFPFYATLPTDGKRHPFFVHINFGAEVPHRYQPTEELVDNGFAVLSFCHNDITRDNADFTDGLAGVLYPDGKRNPTDAGKIAMWAWAAMRVLDFAETKSDILDLSTATVVGHSRLGKTALYTAALDGRFKFAYSNDSGCSGAAITRNKQGETVKVITDVFPYWFCENYKKYADNEHNMPFDQHFLVASIAPRYVLIGSASEDIWADPDSEFICCVAASPAFKNSFKCEDRLPLIDDKFFEGDIGYHLRKGSHYLSRLDWQRLIEFIKLKK